MPFPELSNLINQSRGKLLNEWVAEQLSGSNHRSDLISEQELRTDSERFLQILGTALETSRSGDIRHPDYRALLEVLSDLSSKRGRLGFTPTETASFVFSFKRPFFTAIRNANGANLERAVEDTWEASKLLDDLGLYTTEVFQQSREEVIRRQQEEMLELSTPVVQLWDGVVALPLIGTLDSARTSVVMETLLQTIVETRSEIAIIDITGVPTVDTLVAQHLLKTVAAARLMGADCIISGIRPQIAQTMVHLQIDLSTVITKASLAEALRTALRKGGFSVSRATRPAAATAA